MSSPCRASPKKTSNDAFKRSGSNTQDFPPGYRFCPHDHELIICYLQKKVNKEALPHDRIKAVTLYKHNPAYLTDQYPALGDNKWYFFTPRDRKYPNGERPNRAVGDGYWKATGADKPVCYKDKVVGLKKALVFYVGKPPHGEKTNWIMHEFRVEGPPRIKESKHDMKLDDWVLCMIYKKEASAKGKKGIVEDEMVLSDKEEKGGVFCQAQHKPIPISNPAATFSVRSTSTVNDNDITVGSSSNYIESPHDHPKIAQSIDGYIPQYNNILSDDPPPTLDYDPCGRLPLVARAPPIHLDNKYLQDDDFDADGLFAHNPTPATKRK